VLLTSMNDRLTPAQLAEHRIAACLLKPLKPASLFATILSALEAKPRKELARVTATPAPHPSVSRELFKILVVDDNPVNQTVTCHQLLRLGYHPDIADNGLAAVEAVRQHGYDIVFMDEQMPVMDGIEATAKLREAQKNGDPLVPAHLRIVALTANALPTERERLLKSGMDDFVSKPVTLSAIRAVLERNVEAVLNARQPA
jgi:CheY-like chemotaxis protein